MSDYTLHVLGSHPIPVYSCPYMSAYKGHYNQQLSNVQYVTPVSLTPLRGSVAIAFKMYICFKRLMLPVIHIKRTIKHNDTDQTQLPHTQMKRAYSYNYIKYTPENISLFRTDKRWDYSIVYVLCNSLATASYFVCKENGNYVCSLVICNVLVQ